MLSKTLSYDLIIFNLTFSKKEKMHENFQNLHKVINISTNCDCSVDTVTVWLIVKYFEKSFISFFEEIFPEEIIKK